MRTQQEALNELSTQAMSAEERKVIDEWQDELDQSHADLMAEKGEQPRPEIVEIAGRLATTQEFEQAKAEDKLSEIEVGRH